MDDEAVIQAFRNLKCWTRGDARAPHKPLLLLLALARLQRGEDRWVKFADIEKPLRDLLREFGPQRRTYHPEYPFWWLQSDALWVLNDQKALEGRRRGENKEPPPTALRELGASGSLPLPIVASLKARPALASRVAGLLLDENFPKSMHEDILDSVGFPQVIEAIRRRDPSFRENVLRIYEHRCGVCGYDGRLGQADLGLEAAHVKWHAAGGPDELRNGIALCAFHHKAFDRGAIGFDEAHRVLVSEYVNGSSQVEELIIRFAGALIRGPQRGQPRPDPAFLEWHRREVFRSPPRSAGALPADYRH